MEKECGTCHNTGEVDNLIWLEYEAYLKEFGLKDSRARQLHWFASGYINPDLHPRKIPCPTCGGRSVFYKLPEID
jgi:hypothetical protein